MVKEAVQQLGGECSYPAIKAKIRSMYGEGVNDSSITCSIISGSVNHPSRIHYNENKKPRISDTEYDYLFNTGRGKVVWHEPGKQGVWEIVKTADGGLDVRMVEGVGEDGRTRAAAQSLPAGGHAAGRPSAPTSPMARASARTRAGARRGRRIAQLQHYLQARSRLGAGRLARREYQPGVQRASFQGGTSSE